MMMDMESECFTPPSSPILGYAGTRNQQSLVGPGVIFCLNCKGEPRVGSQDHSFSLEGYIMRRELISSIEVLTIESNRCFTTTGDSIQKMTLFQFFGRKWDPTELPQLKKLLLICRKNISSLEVLADPVFTYGGFDLNARNVMVEDDPNDLCNIEPWKLRKDVCAFLNFVVARMKYYKKRFGAQKIEQLFSGLRKSLRKCQNWSAELKTHCGYKYGNEVNSALYHTFHMNLELRWSLLIIYGADNSTISWICADFIYLAWVKYAATNCDNSSLQKKQPFNCWCVKEIWTMIRLLCDELERDFWKIFSEELKKFLTLNSERDVFFPLWLTSHIATLSDYNLSGMYTPVSLAEVDKITSGLSTSTGFSFINEYLKEWTKRGGKSAEINLIVHQLMQYWGFDLDFIVLFWNHWIPKIDKAGEASSLENFGSVEKWLKLVKGLTTQEKSGPLDEMISGDAFLSFLRLLGGNVRLASPKDWRKLKSHIGMKLNKNNVGEFETGLLRVSTLYLTLAFSTADTVSMCERLKEILQYGRATPGRKKTILRAMATGILLLLQKGEVISQVEITSAFMDMINSMMSSSAMTLDSLKKECIMIYLDLLESLPSPSTPEFNQEKNLGRDALISPNLTMWLSSCGANYAVRTLRVLNKLTSWIISSRGKSFFNHSAERDELGKKIDERTGAFLMQEVILNSNRVPSTDVEPLAFLAADLSFLSKANSKSSDSFSRYFDHFALNERTCPEVSQFYMQRLMTYEDSLGEAVSDVKWSQVWVRLNALDCSIPEELTTKVLGVKFQSTSNGELFQKICQTSEDWSRGDVQNVLSPLVILVKAAVSKVFNESPTVVASIVRSCAIVFKEIKFEKVYPKRDSTSAGHRILEALVPPLIGVAPWDKLPRVVVSALKDYLFDIFEALLTYPGTENDCYLQRKVQDVVIFAVLGFVGSTGEAWDDEHPAVRIMLYSEEKETELVVTQCISLLCKVSKEPKITQRFVLAVSALRNKGLTTSVMRLLGAILSLYVSSSLGSEISNACANIVIYCSMFGQTPFFRSYLMEAFEKGLEMDFAFKSKRFFDLATSISKSQKVQVKRFLRNDLIPMLRKFVEICESRRGSGFDNSLRQPLNKLERETREFEL